MTSLCIGQWHPPNFQLGGIDGDGGGIGGVRGDGVERVAHSAQPQHVPFPALNRGSHFSAHENGVALACVLHQFELLAWQ